jgi:glycine reductase
VQITAALPVAKMVGANRTVLGNGIVHVVGDASLSAEEEKKLRRQLVEKALDALSADKPG